MTHSSSQALLDTPGEVYRGFRVTNRKEIPELQCTLIEMIHEATGAQVMHIANEDPENVFCLSFRTTPTTSNGVAHILEHTVLCGSEKFPIKDPFFAMTRRSLNTFMNAMTGADFTCYPAASQIPKDFYNLLEVYLDAVFQPKLEHLSFRQEGHRLEFADAKDSKTPLEYKGIVYNEMKGAMASPGARLDEIMSAALFPDITYGINSGGDPKVIPTLTYDEFRAFYKEYYHPGRCLFFFYGNLPLQGHLDFIADNTLDKAEKVSSLLSIPRQKRFKDPVYRTTTYPAGPDVDESDKAYVSIGWLTCHILDVDEVLMLEILDSALMDTDASPLRLALLKSGLCRQAGSSLESEVSELPFIVTMRGCDPANAEALEKLLFKELKRIAEEGVPHKLIESAMHQMELYRSEITGDGGPFGLSLFWRSALLKQHGGRTENGLVIHAIFERVRHLLRDDPNIMSKLIEKYLLNNPHRVTVVMTSDKELTNREDADEKAKLAKLKERLTEEDVKGIIRDAKALADFQKEQEEQDIDCLPKLSLDDVPKQVRHFSIDKEQVGNLTVYRHSCFTNSIVYAQVVFDLPTLTEAELPLVRLFGSLASQLGCGGRDYKANLEYMHEHTGGIGTSLVLNPQTTDPNVCVPSLFVKGKALYRKGDKLFALMRDFITSIDFTDTDRIKEVLQKHYTGLEASFNSHAMRYALSLSASGLDIASKIHNTWFGLDYFYTVRDIVKNLSETLPSFIKQMCDLRDRLLNLQNPHLVITCDDEYYQKIKNEGFYGLDKIGTKPSTPWLPHYSLPEVSSQGCIVSTPVAFTGKTFSTITYLHPEAAALSIAGNIIENTVLHQKIREEGGAYGSGAGHNTAYGHFYFYSFRDPNIAQTMKAFEEAVKSVGAGDFSDDDLEEAKLEIIQDSDAPVAPGSRADLAYGLLRCGKTKEMRQHFRNTLLAVTKERVCAAVQHHLQHKVSSSPTVVFAGKELLEKENATLERQGLQPLKLVTV
ncbi:MAG: metalloprotease [Nitrosomonas sp.]|nr:MAG: metalloprotease [Nitrosomonas sp.]